MSKPIVLIAEELSPATVDALGPDFEIRRTDGADRQALLRDIVDVDAILVRSATQVDAEALAAAKKLKVVARAGVGLDNVDVDAATQAGVMVVNAPTSNIVSAAELAVALLLASARNISPAHAALRQGEWKRSKYTGVELADKTVGVVGLGRIGLLVAQRLSAFGVRLVAYDPYVQPARAAQLGVKLLSLEELLERVRFHHRAPAEDQGDGRAHRRRRLEARQAERPHHQCRARRDRRRTGPVRRAGGGPGRRSWRGRLRQGAVHRLPHSSPWTTSWRPRTWGPPPMRRRRRPGSQWRNRYDRPSAGELVPDAVNVRGGVIAEEVRPFIELAEHLGRIATSMAPSAVAQVTVEALGEISAFDVSVLELSTLKGMFSVLVDDPVSYVNAPVLARDRGVVTALVTEGDSPDHRSVVRVRMACADGQSMVVAGTVFGVRDSEKLVEVNGLDLDLPISEHMLVFRYEDKPGVVGIVGQLLGDAGVNIANMQVGRDAAGGLALVALTVDSAVDPQTVAAIAAHIGADSGAAVDLV